VSGRFAANAIAHALSRGDAEGDALARYSESVYDYFEAAWQSRRRLRSQLRVLTSLLGVTPLEHFQKWLGVSGTGNDEERRAG
jgi:hypothetical protein